MPTSFGQVISVLGPGIGYPGDVTRVGERVINARQFVQQSGSGTFNLNFGDPAVLIPNTSGGYWTSVADFINAAASNVALLAAQFAGMTRREVQTQLQYPSSTVPGTLQVGYYATGNMAEVLERGSGAVLLTVGAPSAGAQVYTRVVQNLTNVPGTTIGDWETNPAATDLFSTTATAAAIGTAVTVASGTNTQNGQVVSGFGIAAGSYVVSGGGTTSIVLNQNTNAIIPAGTPITFSNLLALPGTVAHTGLVDSNNMLEITIKVRNVA